MLDERHKTLKNIIVLYRVQAMLGLMSPILAASQRDRGSCIFASDEVPPEDREENIF